MYVDWLVLFRAMGRDARGRKAGSGEGVGRRGDSTDISLEQRGGNLVKLSSVTELVIVTGLFIGSSCVSLLFKKKSI